MRITTLSLVFSSCFVVIASHFLLVSIIFLFRDGGKARLEENGGIGH